MEKQLVEREKNVETYDFVFSSEEVEAAEESVIALVNLKQTIPGFRKGKAPRRIVVNYLGDRLDELVLENLTEELEEALKEEEIIVPATIVDQRRTEDKAVFRVELHRDPKIEIRDYSEMELSVPEPTSVINNYVENRIEELRNENAILEPKEEPVDYGDQLNIEYSIAKDGKVIAAKKKQEMTVEEEDDRPIVTNTIGKKKGDEISFERTFEGSDNTYSYTVEIKDVHKKTLPEVDDEFAKTVSENAKTLAELEQELEKEGSEAYETWKRDFLRQQINQKIVEFGNLEISDKTLEYYVQKAIENSRKDKSYENYLKQAGSEEELMSQFSEGVLEELTRNRIIDEIAGSVNIEVSEEELQQTAERLAPQWGISSDRARELIKSREDVRKDFTENIRRSKVLDLIAEKAKVKELDQPESEESAEQDTDDVEKPDSDSES